MFDTRFLFDLNEGGDQVIDIVESLEWCPESEECFFRLKKLLYKVQLRVDRSLVRERL